MFALLPTVFAGALGAAAASPLSPLSAQMPNVIRDGPGARAFGVFDASRAVIGVTTSGGVMSRDTLGLLVSSVRSGSPAEKAGIEEGNRIASINGMSLKLAAADVGDDDMAGTMTRRLTRELNKLKPGDDVDLRVVAAGQTKNVRVKTIAPDDLRPSFARRSDDDRATLGISILSTGSARDSLGVLVSDVDDNGPAAKAGIEEGTRIASINGVDLRTKAPNDDEDIFTRAHNASRLERELQKMKPGDEADLRVYFNGQYRNVKVKSVRASDLPRRRRAMTIMGDERIGPVVPMPPMAPMPDLAGLRTMLSRVGMGNRVAW